ncbi:MAG: peptidase M19 [Hyphomicrobiales bacterium]|nr:MAG: peptidase M19 [Hyphomicrobiales bacterium]
MIDQTNPPIFDGHNDVLTKLLRKEQGDPEQLFINGDSGHVDLPRSRLAGFAGGFFAIYVPSPVDKQFRYEQMAQPEYDIPLPPALDQMDAMPVALTEAAILLRLQEQGALTICTSAAQLKTTIESGKMAAIMHMEGAEAIDADFHALDVFYAAGLRSLGPVWSRPTIFAHGVPFRYPSSPDTGDGLTEHGKKLISACNKRRIMIDLSHINERGFWDVANITDAPLVATHSNAHTICPTARNLTDRQLAAIKESDGMVGLNFAVAFLREDGQMTADTGIDIMLKHLDYLMEHLGEDRVGFGSDFDGAIIPGPIGDVSGLPVLRKAMRDHGYNDQLMEKLCYRNWLRVLEKTWGN